MNHLRIESLTVYLSGSIPVGFTATLGPRFGMRTMIITRYSFGYWGAAAISLLSIFTEVRISSIENNSRDVCDDLVSSQPYPVKLYYPTGSYIHPCTMSYKALLLCRWVDSCWSSSP